MIPLAWAKSRTEIRKPSCKPPCIQELVNKSPSNKMQICTLSDIAFLSNLITFLGKPQKLTIVRKDINIKPIYFRPRI